MSTVARSSFVALAAALAVSRVLAQDIGQPGFTALYDKHFSYTALPYQVDPDPNAVRGPQSGYNICNSTTEGQSSMCQTAFINAIDGKQGLRVFGSSRSSPHRLVCLGSPQRPHHYRRFRG